MIPLQIQGGTFSLAWWQHMDDMNGVEEFPMEVRSSPSDPEWLVHLFWQAKVCLK